MASSQSLPVPNTHEPAAVVVSVARGAPVAAPAPLELPTPLAPAKAINGERLVIALPDGVEVTVIAAAEAFALACQISELPGRVFARRTSDQLSPPVDETLDVCGRGAVGGHEGHKQVAGLCRAEGRRRHRAARVDGLDGVDRSSPGTGGGGDPALATGSATGVVVFVRPWASVVRAATQCSPSTTLAVSQLSAYGLEVSDPTTLPSTRNWTPPAPAAGALADSVTMPCDVVPSAGAPHVIDGGVVSG